MKEYNRCLDTCTEAAEQDAKTGNRNAREIEQQQQKALEAQFSARAGETEEQTAERIQQDPDVCFIPLYPLFFHLPKTPFCPFKQIVNFFFPRSCPSSRTQ